MDSISEDKKEVDANHYWHFPDTNISKVGVFDYLGSEIGAPDPDKIYKVYRPEEELSNPLTIESFRLMPFIDNHTFLGRDGEDPEKVGVQGAVGEQVYFEYPYLKANIKLYSRFVKEQIEGGKVELSPSYRCKYTEESGEFEGQPYDYIQRGMIANHLALVDEGRTGPDVRIMDSYRITCDAMEEVKMEEEEVEVKQDAASFSDEQIQAIKDIVAAAIKPQDEVTEPAAEPVVENVAIELETIVEELKDLTGMDSAAKAIAFVRAMKAHKPVSAESVIKEIAARDSLVKRVVPHVGVFDTDNMTSAQDVAVYAIDKLGIKCADASLSVATIEGYLAAAKAPTSKTADSAPRVSGKSTSEKLWGIK